MKKLVFAFITVMALTMSACGGNTANGGENDSTVADSVDTVVVDTVDTVVVDTVVAE